jgi:hypothetical protein
MARWQRDPRSRRRLSYLLVGVEVVALTACFLGIFLAYCLRGLLYVGVSPETVHSATWTAGIAATALCAAVAVVVGLKYLAGKRWARAVFVVANGILVGLGLFWFVVHQFRHGAGTDNTAGLVGLLLPMVTLFPLLWPLLRFRPVAESEPGPGP